MGDSILLFFFQNILVIGLIFWLLTYYGSLFSSKKNLKTKKQFYECSFKSISDIEIRINIAFVVFCVLLLIYDSELILLTPLALNFFYINCGTLITFCIFLLFIIIALIYDYYTNAFLWQY